MEKQLLINTPKFPKLSAMLYGDPQLPAIVLLHGFPAEGSLWREVVEDLSQNFQVIVPDLPGVGNSEFEGDEVSVEELATGVAAILEHQNIKKAVIAGHSMGGYVSFAFADLFQEMVAGLSVIHSSAKADDEEKKNARRKSIALIEKGGREAFINAMLPPLFADKFKNEYPEVIETQRMQALDVKDRTLIAFYIAMINRPERLNVLKNAAFPVQWVIGEEDKLAPPEKVLQQTSLANVNFVNVYKNCGHMSMLEVPHQLMKDIRQFATYCAQPKLMKK